MLLFFFHFQLSLFSVLCLLTAVKVVGSRGGIFMCLKFASACLAGMIQGDIIATGPAVILVVKSFLAQLVGSAIGCHESWGRCRSRGWGRRIAETDKLFILQR
jgi:hypothetical protein